MEMGSNMRQVFKRFCVGVEELDACLRRAGYEYQYSDRLGYIATCPCNVGTSMRASAHVRLPQLSSQPHFNDVLLSMRLQRRGPGSKYFSEARPGKQSFAR